MNYPVLGIKYYLNTVFDLARLKVFISVVGGIIFHHIGIEEAMMKSALLIYFIDFALGISIAINEDFKCIRKNGFIYWRVNDKFFSVEKFGWGILKLGLYGMLLIVFNQVDIILHGLFNASMDANAMQTRYYYLGYIAVHEALSIVKKTTKLGLPVPQEIIDRLSRYRKEIPGEKKSDVPVEVPKDKI